MVRWSCPNGCTDVLGPRMPARDATCRVCLKCSEGQRRLVKREALALLRSRAKREENARLKRIRKSERIAASKAMAKERAEQREAEKRENAPRVRTWEYQVLDIRDERGETFGRDDFADAVRAYKKLGMHGRMMKVHEGGFVYRALRGYVVAGKRDRFGNSDLTRPAPGRRLYSETIIGWVRVEPPYRGDGRWSLHDAEQRALFRSATVLYATTRPLAINARGAVTPATPRATTIEEIEDLGEVTGEETGEETEGAEASAE